HWPGARVGIEQREVSSAEGHVALRSVEFIKLSRVPYYIGYCAWVLRTSQGQQAQGGGARQMWHEARGVAHGVQTHDTLLSHQGLEQCCLTCDDRRRYEVADTASGAYQELRCLDEEYGRLQRRGGSTTIAACMAQQMHHTLRLRRRRDGLPGWFPQDYIEAAVPAGAGILRRCTG